MTYGVSEVVDKTKGNKELFQRYREENFPQLKERLNLKIERTSHGEGEKNYIYYIIIYYIEYIWNVIYLYVIYYIYEYHYTL